MIHNEVRFISGEEQRRAAFNSTVERYYADIRNQFPKIQELHDQVLDLTGGRRGAILRLQYHQDGPNGEIISATLLMEFHFTTPSDTGIPRKHTREFHATFTLPDDHIFHPGAIRLKPGRHRAIENW